jgi:membrane associated rhomboid family serine protease
VLVFGDLLRNFSAVLTDHAYLRSDYPHRNTSAVVWLLASLVAAFVIELLLLSPWFGSSGHNLVSELALTIRGVKEGHVWIFLTHGLLHSTGNPFHILVTVLGLIFIGREVEPLLGRRRFLAVYISTLMTGGLAWTAVHWGHGGVYLGASAAVLGLLTVLALFYPDHEINFLLLFLFPVTVRPKYVIAAVLLINLFLLGTYEIPGKSVFLNYSPAAHLGGMLAGWVYFKYFHANNGWDRAPSLKLPVWLHRNAKAEAMVPEPTHKSATSSAELRAQADLILDKINSHGFGALTDDEKRFLDEAKDLLSRS